MSNAAGVVGRLARAGWPLLQKNWPLVLRAVQTARTVVKDHPEAPSWVRSRVTDITTRLAAAQTKPNDAARIRSMLDTVRETAQESWDDAEITAAWAARANALERVVRLAESLDPAARAASLARVKQSTDALVADLIDAIVNVTPRGPDVSGGATVPGR